MTLDVNHEAFLALVRAGLWEQEIQLFPFQEFDLSEVYHISENQAVFGIVAVGLEYVCDIKVPQEAALAFAGVALQLEQRNKAMNVFIAELLQNMQKAGIYSLLLKGQGIAQCYKRPLWRTCGDVDLLLSPDEYKKAAKLLSPLASRINDEDNIRKHLAMVIGTWDVELHGTLRTGLWSSIDMTLDQVQDDVFCGVVRSWMNNDTQVFLLGADEDLFLVFSHILQHFFVEGIGLRQICDWCRHLYTFHDSVNNKLLEKRLKKAGILLEWKVFAAMAVDYLGMDENYIPFYDSAGIYHRKAQVVLQLLFKTGNFGYSRSKSYKTKYSTIMRYVISFCRHTKDAFWRFQCFPRHSICIWFRIMWKGVTTSDVK